MTAPDDGAEAVRIPIDADQAVSGLVLNAPGARVCYVFAHGAGAGMRHAFMVAVARGLAERGIATLRFQFPYMERGSKRPDSPRIAHAAVRAAVAESRRLLPGMPLFAGGRSFGGRMSSQAQALCPLPGVRGLVFLGFPLHPDGKPSTERAEHLSDVRVPMLFVQGERDRLAEAGLIRQVVDQLGERATLTTVPGEGHAFEPAEAMLDGVAQWMLATATD